MIRTLRSTRIPFLIVLLGLGGLLEARAQALPPLDEYHIRSFGTADGLPIAEVRDLAQTSDGYLYVATGRGLVRFDGYRFHRVPTPGFQSSIWSLFYDARDRLWIISITNELGYLENGRFYLLPPAPGTFAILPGATGGDVWFGGRSGVLRIRPGSSNPYARFTIAHGLPGDTILGVFELPRGTRVVVTKNQLASIEEDSTRVGGIRFVPFGPRYDAAAAGGDSSGLWIITHEHESARAVLHYDGHRFTRRAIAYEQRLLLEGEALAPLWAVYERAVEGLELHVEYGGADEGPGLISGRTLIRTLRGRDSTQWLALGDPARDHYFLVRRRAGQLERIPLRRHLDFHVIEVLFEDQEGSLWVGTDRGLLQLAPRRVYTLTRRHGLTDGFTVPVLQTRDGAVWVGTWGGGLHRFAGGRLTHHFGTENGLPHDEVRALYEAADGTLWVGMNGYVAALRNGEVVFVEPTPGEARAFAETSDGTLWIGTGNQLLFRTPRGFAEHRPDLWRGKQIWATHSARDGALWIGTQRGLFRLAGDSLRAYGEADGLSSPFVVSIHEEADGTLWFGTYAHGLHRYRDGQFVAVTTREGLHHNGVWRMVEDGRGGVWMSSDGGIFRVEHARLHAVADAVERGERPERRLSPLVFTEAEGMPNREGNRASPAGWRLDDGRLVFNNLAGVVLIDPVRATAPAPPPPTVLQGVFADGEPVARDQEEVPELPAGVKQLAFDYAALSFIAPEQNRYRYRLDGYDDAWVRGGSERRARYTNLAPGRYTFRVQGRSGMSAWSEPGAVYAFVVPPLLWQTWWFRLLTVSALAGLLAAGYRYRVRRLLEMERMRLRIAADLHDDVGSNLSSIALLSEMLEGRTHLDGLEQRQLERIHLAADETMDALRDIIWLVDPKHDELADLIRRMRGVAGDLLNGTACRFEGAVPAEDRRVSMVFMRNVLLIYKEALHNVAKHSRATRVDIEVRHDRGRFVLRIEDDGVGFDEAGARAGNGLENMRRRARKAGGRIELASAPENGTRITFTAPLA